ncbi:acyl-CoA dehydrogenase family protein [uncultured Flavobacterium sp.]|uniref:acyl-CoA dehydrogenase family protein n=1 Tax=uncultured Flavobacterium sp. TaxID=165435 RepID=UPI0030CA4160
MITLFSSERLKLIYPKVKTFVEQELYPIELELLHLPFKKAAIILEEKRTKAKQMGLWAPYLSEKDGGLGLNMIEFAQISELMAMTPFGHYVFNCQAPDIGNIELMHKHASNSLKEKFLQPLMKGEIRSCFSMTEPEFAGSNPINMGTTAVLDGDEYVINGHKWFTTSADGANFAIVMANTNENASRYERASMILVPTNTIGFHLKRNISIMGETGEGWSSHAEIEYINCRVPATNLIGKEGSGFLLAQERLGPGRIHHCMRWIGTCERAFEMMCKRAVNRDMGDGTKLGQKQTIQNWIAESRAEINAARFMVLHAANKMDSEGSKAAKTEISAIKFFVAGILMKVLDRAIQTHGALGVTDDTLLSFWYRHERGARIYDGPDEVHKSSLAKAILKGYGLKI